MNTDTKTILKRQRRRGNRQTNKTTNEQHVAKFAGDSYNLAMRAYRGLNTIRQLINVEEKYIDINDLNVTSLNTGVVYCLTQVAQGTDFTNRVGDSIKVQKFSLNIHFYTALTEATVRITIIKDSLQNGSNAPTAAVLYQNSGTVLTTVSHISSVQSVQKRFRILLDETMELSNAAAPGTYAHYEIPLDRHVSYIGTAAAAGSNGVGSIYLIVSTNATATQPIFDFTSRVVFTDD